MIAWFSGETKRKPTIYLGVDSPFFPTIVVLKNRYVPLVFGGFLE